MGESSNDEEGTFISHRIKFKTFLIVFCFVFVNPEQRENHAQKKRKKFDYSIIEPARAKSLQSMASNVSSKLSNALSSTFKANQRRTINKENVTTFDVYVQSRHLEKLIRGMDKKLDLNPKYNAKHDNEEVNDYPFILPMATIDDVECCEKFIREAENYQQLVKTSFLKLFFNF